MKNAYILCLILVLFSYCRKNGGEDPNTSGTITGNIDGLSSSFGKNAKGTISTTTGACYVQVVGFMGTPGNSDQFAIAIAGTTPVVAGTYNESGSTYAASIGFTTASPNAVYTSYESTTNPAIVTITEINRTSVRGTFKGDMYLVDESGVTATKKVVADGQFNVRFR